MDANPRDISTNNKTIDILCDSDWSSLLDIPTENTKVLKYQNMYSAQSSSDDTERSEDSKETIDLISHEEIAELEDIEILRMSSILSRELKSTVSRKFKKDLQNTMDWVITSMCWLKHNMSVLSERLGQKPPAQSNHNSAKHQVDNSSKSGNPSKPIGRNSYKFCDYEHRCNFSYGDDTKRHCYSQHFVYPLVLSDINSLIEYIDNTKSEEKQDTNTNMSFQREIITSINTITYVINHMHTELDSLRSEFPSEYSKYVSRKIILKCIVKSNKKRYRKKRSQN